MPTRPASLPSPLSLALKRRLGGLHPLLTALALACATWGASAQNATTLSMDIPEEARMIAAEENIKGLFSPTLRTDTQNQPTAPLNRDAASPTDLNATAAETPAFPETLLDKAPADLGRIAAPASERDGVPEPVFIRDLWVFSTPVDRLTPLKKAYGEGSGLVRDIPSTLSRLDHITAEALPQEYWLESARLQKLPVEALYAVALQESGLRIRSGQVQPWPWTLNCNAPCPHGPMRFAGKQAASDALEKLLKAGWRNIDIGAMQVNYRAHAKRFAAYDLLDPRINIIIGGVILREAVQQAGGQLKTGFALYHVGTVMPENQDRAQHYANSVGRWVTRLKQSGELNLARN